MDKWRTPEAAVYRKLYGLKAWRVVRAKALLRDLYTCQHKRCGVSLKKGRTQPQSAVVHHLKPHKGNHDLFFDLDNLQSVCWSCHSGDIQSSEARGFDVGVNSSGLPTDPNHPFNK